LVLVSEHGAAIHGDREQIQGMREIPSPAITKVPLAIKLIGLPGARPDTPIFSDQRISYLAISELLNRMMASDAATKPLEQMIDHLPETDFVSANEDTTIMGVNRGFYIQEGANPWAPYATSPP
jgi:hypothetical protein